MDFRTDRSRHYDPQPRPQRPAVHVPPPPPRPETQPLAETHEPKVHKRVRKPSREGGRLSKKVLLFAAGLLLAAVIAWLAHGYVTTKNQLEAAKTNQAAANPALQVQQKVALLADVPQGETPTVATVTNADKVHNTAFFKDALDGDKVLFYPNSGLAVLYRPSSNKIIRFQPASLENTSTTNTSSTPNSPTKK